MNILQWLASIGAQQGDRWFIQTNHGAGTLTLVAELAYDCQGNKHRATFSVDGKRIQ